MSAALALVRPVQLGELAQAVADAAQAEAVYLASPFNPDSLRDLDLHSARREAEAALTARLIALGIASEHARTMTEALT